MNRHVRWLMAAAATATAVTVTVAACGAGSGATSTAPVGPAASGSDAASGSAAGSATVTAPQSRTPTGGASSAQGAAQAYYAAVAAHDPDAARQYLSPEYLSGVGGATAFADWTANYRSLTHLDVRATQAPGPDVAQQHPGYRALALVPVTYTAALRTPSANEVDGALDRFVLLGSSRATGAWLILDITTSP